MMFHVARFLVCYVTDFMPNSVLSKCPKSETLRTDRTRTEAEDDVLLASQKLRMTENENNQLTLFQTRPTKTEQNAIWMLPISMGVFRFINYRALMYYRVFHI